MKGSSRRVYVLHWTNNVESGIVRIRCWLAEAYTMTKYTIADCIGQSDIPPDLRSIPAHTRHTDRATDAQGHKFRIVHKSACWTYRSCSPHVGSLSLRWLLLWFAAVSLLVNAQSVLFHMLLLLALQASPTVVTAPYPRSCTEWSLCHHVMSWWSSILLASHS